MNTYFSCIEKNLQVSFSQNLTSLAKKVQDINHQVKLATSEEDISKIIALRKRVYSKLYPASLVDVLDEFDYHSLLFLVEDSNANVIGTCRLVIDSDVGFLEDAIYTPFVQTYRTQGKLLAEWGRCAITDECSVRAFDFANIIQQLAVYLSIDYVLIFNRQCDVPRVLSSLDTKVLVETNKNFGSQHKFTAVLWSIPQNKVYEPTLWDNYSRSFLTVTTRYQIDMLTEASQYLTGNVVDCGSGCAKIAPYLANNNNIISYTALDASPLMCQLGKQVLSKLNKNNFQIKESYIEHWQANSIYESAVSINSLYTWSNPLEILKHIYTMLKLDGILVLANINDSIDIPLLIQNTKADLLMHPDYDTFCEINLKIDANPDAHRYSIDEMIQLVHQTGPMP